MSDELFLILLPLFVVALVWPIVVYLKRPE